MNRAEHNSRVNSCGSAIRTTIRMQGRETSAAVKVILGAKDNRGRPMKERYDIYFTGQILNGNDPISVRDKLAKLFKADKTTLNQLFSGKVHLIKRNCDHDTALKYKRAMEQAGASPIIKSTGVTTATEEQSTPAASAAQKIAALASAPDTHGFQQAESDVSSPKTASEPSTEFEGIDLTPAGTEVLREEERAEPVTRDIDTTGLEVDITAARLSEETTPHPAMLDTDHLSLADAGESIPNLPPTDTPLSPSLDSLALSDPGTDFSDCAIAQPQAPELDLSALSVESPGADILDKQYQKAELGEAPSTDHLSLED